MVINVMIAIIVCVQFGLHQEVLSRNHNGMLGLREFVANGH